MERLTGRKENGHAYIIGCPDFEIPKIAGMIIQNVVNKCADIEDIFGNYDLDRLREAVEKQAEYESFMKKWKQAVEIAGSVKQLGAERVAELVEADRDGRCVVLPCNLGDHIYRVVAGYIFEGIFFIEDAPRFGKNVFLTREAAEEALRDNQHEKCL